MIVQIRERQLKRQKERRTHIQNQVGSLNAGRQLKGQKDEQKQDRNMKEIVSL